MLPEVQKYLQMYPVFTNKYKIYVFKSMRETPIVSI